MRYHQLTEEDEIPAPDGVIEWIKPIQLLNFYHLIHQEVEARHPPRSDIPLTPAQIEAKIDDKDCMFGVMLDNAIKELWGEDEDKVESHEELYKCRGGWNAGRFSPCD